MALRGHGGVTFLDINDGSGKIQALIKVDKLGEKGYQFFLDVFDIADLVEIKGKLFKTKRGEKTIEAEDYKCFQRHLPCLKNGMDCKMLKKKFKEKDI